MLGIDDPVVLLAYVLCLASTLLCVVYGVINWNKGQDEALPEDVKWSREEKQSENGA
jgi:hypothetical protein